jgi:KaiC/GvpD/RAD55 family RecA-like ATPase
MPFIDAERTQLYARVALFGPSGSGKTMTGLRIAKGIAEKMGLPFAVIDTEARSASKYAGTGRFAFKVDNLKDKTIDHYLTSMEEAKNAGYKVLVIDSLTHAWRELTEEVDRIALRSNSKNTFTPWAQVNPKQKRLIDAILNYPGHIIVTMRSKTEWVITQNKDGKSTPQKIGLAPEQGKGIEYEFDLLIEMDQNHYGTITKDHTDKYQDAVIEKPGEDFGIALYEWLASGKPEMPTVTPTAEKAPAKPEKAITAPAAKAGRTPAKPVKKEVVPMEVKAGKPIEQLTLKEQGTALMQEISTIITASKDNIAYFSDEEKEEARQIIKGTKLNEKDITELRDFKVFLSNELTKRETKKADNKAA